MVRLLIDLLDGKRINFQTIINRLMRRLHFVLRDDILFRLKDDLKSSHEMIDKRVY